MIVQKRPKALTASFKILYRFIVTIIPFLVVLGTTDFNAVDGRIDCVTVEDCIGCVSESCTISVVDCCICSVDDCCFGGPGSSNEKREITQHEINKS